MRVCRLAALIALVASARTAAAQEVRISMLPWREPVLLDTMRQNHEINAPAAKVYEATHRAFAELGIPVGNTDPTRGVIGSERFQKAINLAGSRMSMLYDCGDGGTGPYADSYRLEIAVAAFVKPNDRGGTTFGVATIATGRDPSGTSRAARACVSTGQLEEKLYQRVVLATVSRRP